MLSEDDVRRIVRKMARMGQRLGPRRESPEEERERLRLMTAGVAAGVKVAPLSLTRHTTDSADPRLGRGADETPRPQNEVYLVLSEAERAKGFLRPVRDTYSHLTCGTTTTMGAAIAETYARDPWHYGSTYCVNCAKHRPLAEFVWLTGESMDPALWPSEVLDAVVAMRAKLDGAAS